MTGMLLCAGLGTRFRPVTEKIAKTSIPFLNVPLMGYGLFYLEQLGLTNLVVNTHHLPKSVYDTTDCLTHNSRYNVQFLEETPRILGSGGGIKNAEVQIRSDKQNWFIVANGDEVILFDHADGLKPLVDHHVKSGALATLLTTEHPQAGKEYGGVWFDKSGKITKLGEKGDGAKHFTGVFVFSNELFDLLPAGRESHIFKDALLPAMAAGKLVQAFHDPKLLWLDSGSERAFVRSSRTALEQLRDKTVYGTNLEKILTRFHANSTRADQITDDPKMSKTMFLGKESAFRGLLEPGGIVLLGPGAQIEDSVDVKGFAVLGANARFKNGVLENATIAPGLHVSEMVALRNQVVV